MPGSQPRMEGQIVFKRDEGPPFQEEMLQVWRARTHVPMPSASASELARRRSCRLLIDCTTDKLNGHLMCVHWWTFYCEHTERVQQYFDDVEPCVLCHAMLCYAMTLYWYVFSRPLHQQCRIAGSSVHAWCSTSHVTPLCRDLHWPQVISHIRFKTLVLANMAVSGTAPTYL